MPQQNTGGNTPDTGPVQAPVQPTAAPTPGPSAQDTMQQGFQERQAAQGESYGKLLNQRTKTWKPEFWQQNPSLATELATSTLPESTIRSVATHWPELNTWVNQHNAFGGVDGALVTARVKALNIADPQARADALATIDALASMSPENQIALAGMLKVQTGGVGGGTETNSLATAIGANPSDITVDTATGGIGITGGTTSEINRLAQLESMFPELQGKIHFTGGGISLTDIAYGLENPGSQSINVKALVIGGLEKAFHGMQVPFDKLGDVLAPLELAAERHVSPTSLAGQVFTGIGHGLEATNRVTSTIIQDSAGALGVYANAAWWKGLAHGNIPGITQGGSTSAAQIDTKGNLIDLNANPTVEGVSQNLEYTQIIGGLIQAVVLHSAFTAAGAITTLGDMPEALAAEKFINPEELTTLQKVIHPIKSFLDPRIQSAMQDVFGKSPEEFFGNSPEEFMTRNGYVQDYLKGIQAIQDNPRILDKQAEVLNTLAYNGSLTEGLAKKLLAAPTVEDKWTVALDAMRGSDPAAFDAATQAVTDAQGDLGKNHENYRTATQDLISARQPSRATTDELASINEEIDRRTPASYRAGEPTGMDEMANALSQPGNQIQLAVDNFRQNQTLDPVAGAAVSDKVPGTIYQHIDNSGLRTLYYVDDSGKVLGYRVIKDSAESITATGLQGQGIGTALEQTYLREQGITNAAQFLDYLKAKEAGASFTPAGAALNKSVAKTLGGGEDLQARQFEAQANLSAARENLAQAQARLQSLPTNDAEQVFWPGMPSHSLTGFLHRLETSRTPLNSLERFGRAVFSPIDAIKSWTNKIFSSSFKAEYNFPKWMSNLTSKLDNKPFLWNPDHPGFNDIKLQENITVIRRVLNNYGASKSDIAATVQSFLDPKSPTDVFNAAKAFGDLRKSLLPKNTPSHIINATGRAFDNEFNIGYNTLDRTLQDGTVITEPVRFDAVVNGTPQAKPFLPSEFLHAEKLHLPSQELMDLATKTIRRWEFSTSKWESSIAKSWGWTRVTADMVGRGLMFPAYMAFRLPSLLIKHTLDPIIGNLASADLVSAASIPNYISAAYDELAHPSPGVMGSVTEDLLREPGMSPYTVNLPTASYIVDGKLTAEGALGFRNKMEFYKNDALSSAILNELDLSAGTLDPAALVDHIRSSSFLGDHLTQNLRGLDDAELTRLIDRQAQAIQQSALGDPYFLDYMKTGRQRITPPTNDADIADIEARLSELNPLTDQSSITALQKQLRQLYSDSLAEGTPQGYRYSSEPPGSGLLQEIQDRFAQNQLTLPKNVQVTRMGKIEYRDAEGNLVSDGNLLDSARELDSKLKRLTFRVFKPVGFVERKLGRGAFFGQRGYQWTKVYEKNGMSSEDALANATMRASLETKDMFYNLAARSTTERQLKNVFWFAPATGEMLYRWFYAIPAQATLGPGLLLNAAKLVNYVDLAKNMGLVVQDPKTGEQSVPITGVANFFSKISGGAFKLPEGVSVNIPLAKLDPLVTSPIPTMAPIPGFALSTAGKYIPLFKHIASVLAPLSNITGLVPYDVRNAAGMLGIKIPDLMNSDAIDEEWKRVHIAAVQYAMVDATKEGHAQPTLAQFHLDPEASGYLQPTDPKRADAEAAYTKAKQGWNDWVMNDAQSIARGLYMTHVLVGSFLPGSPSISTPEQVPWEMFVKQQMNLTPSEWTAVRDKWLTEHPASEPFSISGGRYTGKFVPSNITPLQLYTDHYKEYMTMGDYQRFAAAMNSKFVYDQRLADDLNAISPNGDAPTLLRNWGDRKTSISNRNLAWDQYLRLNPDAKGILEQNYAQMQKAYPSQYKHSLEMGYLNDTLTNLSSLSTLFAGEGGLNSSEFSTVVTTIKAERAKLYSMYRSTGTAPSQAVKDMDWWFNKILDPMMNKTNPLYQEAALAAQAGKPTADIYAKINEIKAQYEGAVLQHNGENYPTPDEFFFGSKTPYEQTITVANWATKPVSWLSDWQRQKVGYTTFDGEDKMFSAMTAVDQSVTAAELGKTLTQSQLDYYNKWADSQKQAIAGQYGQAGLDAYALESAAPYVRLQTNKTFASDSSMNQAYKMADYIHSALASQGLSPDSTGAYGLSLKNWFFDWIDQQASGDPQFKKDLTTLSLGLTTGPKGSHPLGVFLYEGIFFNQFNSAYVPTSKINIAGG